MFLGSGRLQVCGVLHCAVCEGQSWFLPLVTGVFLWMDLEFYSRANNWFASIFARFPIFQLGNRKQHDMP